MTSPSAAQHRYPYQNEPTWSRSEMAIARQAFDAALGRELQEVIQEAKKIASQIQQASDLWDLEYYLTERRKEIDRRYDSRSSRLTDVLGRLLYEKIDSVRSARIAGRKDEINPFFCPVSQRRRRNIGPNRPNVVIQSSGANQYL